MKKVTLPLSISVLMLSLTLPVFAAEADYTDFSLAELMDVKIYAASKYEQKQSDAPSAVSVVTADEIRNYGWRNLAELLRAQRGMYIGYDRIYGSLGVRGFLISGDYNTRILITVDGQRISDVVYDQGFIMNDFILDLDLIERVEIIRGPGSTLHGATPLLGVINVVTREVKRGKQHELKASVGTGRWQSGRYTVSKVLDDQSNLLLSASAAKTDGERLSFELPQGTTDHTDYETVKRLFAKYKRNDTNVLFAYATRDKGIPTGATGSVFDNRDNHYKDAQANFNVSQLWRLAERSSLEGRFYVGWYNFFGNFVYDDGAGGLTYTNDLAWGRWQGGELKLVRQGDNHTLIGGVEFQNNARQDQATNDIGGAVHLNDKRNSNRYGLYLQDEWRQSARSALTLGVRYDVDHLKQSHISPKLAWVFSPADNKTLKFLAASAYRTPTVYEMYYSYGTDVIPNHNLQSEHAKNIEAVFEHQLTPNTRYTINPYLFKFRQQISQLTLPDGSLQFQNAGSARVQGIEFELQHHFEKDGKLRTSYSVQQGKDGDNLRLTDSPRQIFTLNYSQPILGEKLQTGLEMQYVAPRLTFGGSYTQPTQLLNAGLNGKLWPNGPAWSAYVYNVFNYRYDTPDTPDTSLNNRDRMTQDGRQWRSSISVPF